MSKKNATYSFEIHSIDVFPNLFEVTATETRVEEGEKAVEEGVYILEFKKGKHKNYEITRCVADWMYDNKNNKKCPGTEIKNKLELEENDFKNKVYLSYWNVLNAEDRVEGKGVFELKRKVDGSIISDGKIRFAFSQAVFRKDGGKKSHKSSYWLGDEKTEIKPDSKKSVSDYSTPPSKNEESKEQRSEIKLKDQSSQQPDSLFSDLFFENINFEHQITNVQLPDVENFSDLRKIYNSYKIKEEEHNYIELLYCVWILYEFLDYFDSDLLQNVFLHLGTSSLDKAAFREAFEELERSGFIYIDDNFILSRKALLEEMFADEDYIYVCDDLERLVPLFSELKEMRLLVSLGYYFYSEDLIKNAIICFKEITNIAEIKEDRKHISGSYNNWGLCLFETGKYEEAIKKYEKSIEIEPEYAQPYNNWGFVLGKLGKYEEAIKKYEKAIEIEPRYIQAYFNYGLAFYALQKYDKAQKKYEKAIELKPDYVDAYINCGNALKELERFEEACMKYNKAIEIDPKFAGAYYNLAQTLKEMNPSKIETKNILGLFTKAYFLFISREEWEFANKTAILYILNKSEEKKLNNIISIFNIGVTFVLNPSKGTLPTNIKILDNIKKGIEKKEGKSIRPYIVIVDALLENKNPSLKIDPKSDDLILNAAIVLANEIVATSSQPT